jgi:hypothetical protein
MLDRLGQSVNEAVPTQTKWAVAIASLTATRPDAVQKFIDDNNLNSEKLYQFLKKSKLDGKMDFVTALVGKPNNPIQRKMIKMFGESVNEDVSFKDGKYHFYSKSGAAYLTYNGQKLSDGDFDRGADGYFMSHSSFRGQKFFEDGNAVIAYFKKNRIVREFVKNESVNEGIGTIALGVAGGLLLLKLLKVVVKKVLGTIGMNVPLPKEKLLEVVETMIKTVLTQSSGPSTYLGLNFHLGKEANILKIVALRSFLKDEINAGKITTIKQIIQIIDKLSKNKVESVNEATAIGKKIFSDAKGKLFFGYQNDDDTVQLVDYKTWKKLSMKDLSNEFLANRVINSIVRNERQFNKKVEYNMWSKKTNPSFEDRMDWFIKNGWISNITKAGIKEGVELVNESSVEIGDIIFFPPANSAATVVDRFGRSVTLKLANGKKVKTVVDKVKLLAQDGVNEHKDSGCDTSLTEGQLNEWKAEEVLQQLGGRKFIAMTGANNFVKNDKAKSIIFKLPRAKSGIKYVRITLTSMDVYNIEFISARGSNIKTVATAKGVYNDELQSTFTQYTGLYTSL